MPVSNPRFSAFSISSCAVPMRLHSAIKSARPGLFSDAAFASGWSGASARNFAPNKVSGRVVKISRSVSPCGVVFSSSAKRTMRPSERPIQFFCISRTFSGHRSSPSSASSSSWESSPILKNHCVSSRCSTSAPDRQPRPSITCSLASTV